MWETQVRLPGLAMTGVVLQTSTSYWKLALSALCDSNREVKIARGIHLFPGRTWPGQMFRRLPQLQSLRQVQLWGMWGIADPAVHRHLRFPELGVLGTDRGLCPIVKLWEAGQLVQDMTAGSKR